ncbi:LPS translocon maturation chaperone LptM [Halioglobus pacificus]|nr:lipoprotein [Halioglobus pacificus]
MRIVLIHSLLACLLLAGCGQTGPLYYPEPPAPEPPPAQDSSDN